MNREFIQARITATQAQIIAYEAATEALASGGVQSYTLDTGQSVQKVTKLDLEWIGDALNGAYNRCATLEARLNGGSVTGRPAW